MRTFILFMLLLQASRYAHAQSTEDNGPPSAPGSGPYGASDGDEHIYTVGKGVSRPVLLHTENPEYTEDALNARYQGVAVVRMVVDANGEVGKAYVMRSLGMGLDEKAVEAVRKYRFRPALFQGRPVPVFMVVEVPFRLP